MMSPTYIAISIGPVFETLNAARKTRELWAASYFLSYIMRELSKKLPPLGKVLIPSLDEIDKQELLGAGRYPDKIYLECPEGKEDETFLNVADSIKDVVKQAAQNIFDSFTYADQKSYGRAGAEEIAFHNPFTYDQIESFLNGYLKLNAVRVPIAPGRNIATELGAACDLIDQQPRIIPQEGAGIVDSTTNRNPLQLLFHIANWSFLYKDGFAADLETHQNRIVIKNSKRNELIELLQDEPLKKVLKAKPAKGFDSLIEIASRELQNINPGTYNDIINRSLKDSYATSKEEDDTEEQVVALLKKGFPKDFNDYHKYVAIVHADGDNIGKIINIVGSDPILLQPFSNDMLQFARQATERVVQYGGSPIYMSGDDLLFITPVCTRSSQGKSRKNIFDLLFELDEAFSNTINKKYDEQIRAVQRQRGRADEELLYPSMSYGLAITFYKYPLYESKMLSFNMLHAIKQDMELKKQKNVINVSLMKHSGQMIPFSIPKLKKPSADLWEAFRDFVSQTNKSESFLNSFTYKLETLKPLIIHCAAQSNGKERLQHLFENSFNENYHTNSAFYHSLESFIVTISDFYGLVNEQSFRLLYGALRFVHFIHHDSR